MRAQFKILIGLSALATACLGCGGNSPDIAPVSGKVLVDGQPLTEGMVRTLPKSGRGAKGMIQPDGTFALGTLSQDDGATVGTHKVGIVAYEGGIPPGPEATPGKRLIPKRYFDPDSSGLTIDVKAGEENHPVLELSSK
jgi:hypothetical protein